MTARLLKKFKIQKLLHWIQWKIRLRFYAPWIFTGFSTNSNFFIRLIKSICLVNKIGWVNQIFFATFQGKVSKLKISYTLCPISIFLIFPSPTLRNVKLRGFFLSNWFMRCKWLMYHNSRFTIKATLAFDQSITISLSPIEI